jgi:DNA-binding transcriptional LysR family regulator
MIILSYHYCRNPQSAIRDLKPYPEDAMLNQQWLTTFIKLVQIGHFTQTAEKLFMTQPGVSQHIKKLEQQVGVALINRIGKGFELTQAGLSLFDYGVKLQQEQAQLLGSFQVDDAFAGECRIACSGSMAMLIYPHLIEYQLQHPQLSMSVEAAPNKLIIDRVLNNHIDMGIITQPLVHSDLEIHGIGEQKLNLVLPAAFKAAASKTKGTKTANFTTISYDELQGLGMIHHPDAMHYWQQIVARYFPEQLANAAHIPIRSHVNQLSQILMPVAKGLGFAVLPEFAVTQSDQALVIAHFEASRLASALHLSSSSTASLGEGATTKGEQDDSSVSEPLFVIYKRHRPLAQRYQAILSMVKTLIKP